MELFQHPGRESDRGVCQSVGEGLRFCALDLLIRGFSGAPDIAKVEISDDDGATWQFASLDSRHDPYAWRRWSFAWRS